MKKTDIELLQSAIDALEHSEPSHKNLCAEIRARLAESDDEPVAYRHMMDDGWEYFDAPNGEDCEGCQKLYRHPSRQLVRLSDEEILAIAGNYTAPDRQDTAEIGLDGEPTGEFYPLTLWVFCSEELTAFARELLEKAK